MAANDRRVQPAVEGVTRLVVVFNTPFERNIPRLESIYAERFSGLLHLMPFYEGDLSNVVPVFANPSHFHGFFAQSIDEVETSGYDFYAFIGDDLVLNPYITGENLAAELGLDESTGFIKEIKPLAEQPFRWQPLFRGVRPFIRPTGIDYGALLPDVDEARRRAIRHVGPQSETLTLRNLRDWHGDWHLFDYYSLLGLWHILRAGGKLRLPYPLLVGYSDIVVVPTAALRRFARLCGIFAAMGVFVEVAIPTALALCCERIVTDHLTPWSGKEIWDDEVQAMERRFDRRLSDLLASFEERQLYLHPVKLSRWSDD